MQQAKGMLGGELCQFSDDENHYLVISYWQSESHHNNTNQYKKLIYSERFLAN
ncbi:antibiotic biosynthesis monooxygenase [Shewanella sp. D64]|nr:antibiotic biosynthesis monooxygenase [Shewanella sp. D64]MEC4738218.1 antibiotic biosynthesis monooxygenase [Shewanella sp. E94]WBJ98309.1 antibiotic biosynthesis monooxygenase [Shewanella sp. MTB7]